MGKGVKTPCYDTGNIKAKSNFRFTRGISSFVPHSKWGFNSGMNYTRLCPRKLLKRELWKKTLLFDSGSSERICS
ncbi:hypothetical protein DCAR_0727244 [Daucus carota subsp. sativus]|uniref:Uncharacterized protein n=1 Tax=Daucus carota subsp. sativus TaxID=79200 RepID=A0A161Y391_DAUCS|nr:hypothetical protein DCAR_0727244 [Daucus carota subsp. sativus]